MKVALIGMVILGFLFTACGGDNAGSGQESTTSSASQDTTGDSQTTEPTEAPGTTSAEPTTSTSQPDPDEGDGGGEVVGLTGRIAWSSDRDGNREIYVMDLSDFTIVRLTEAPAPDYYPSWSPDGTMIAFASERDGNREIYVIGSDGSGLTRLTDNPGEDTRPAWSPDGSLIAFASQRGPANLELWVMNADGSDQRRLTADIETIDAPTWSPDGSQIAYHLEKQFGPFELAAFDLASEQVEFLFEGGAEPSWSPTGEAIAYTVLPGLDIGVFDLTAGTGAAVVGDLSDEQDPEWSPDGEMFVFWSNRDGNPELYVTSADGSELIRLTDDPGVDRNPSWGP